LNKVAGTLETISTRLRPDGTIDFSLLYFGGHTGRWSGGGSGLNLQNLLKDSLVVNGGRYLGKKADLESIPEGADLINMRHLFRARPGKKFIICDAAQIEPRILNWIAGNKELLEKIRQGFSFYESYAITFEGWKGEPGTIKSSLGPERYTRLKNKALGLGFQMGWRKYTSYAGVSEEEAKQVVEGFRKENQKLVALWEYLDKSFRVHVGQEWDCQLPSGRVMRYGKVRREVRHKKDSEGKMVPRFVYTGETSKSGYIARTDLYGGILTENMVQATARDVLAFHLLELDREGYNVIFHVHDEFITEVDEGTDPKQIEGIMSRCPDWIPGLPLAAEGHLVDHYTKL
jgi:DNA polymerase